MKAIVAVLGIAGLTAGARADIAWRDSPSKMSEAALSLTAVEARGEGEPAAAFGSFECLSGEGLDCLSDLRHSDWSAPVPPGDRRNVPSQVRELPGLPGSAPLCFSALATLGAIKLVRTGRKVNFSGAPDWYYTGPYRANGCVLDLDMYPLPACRLATDPADKPLIMLPVRAYGERPPARPAECVLTTLDLRGPPAAL